LENNENYYWGQGSRKLKIKVMKNVHLLPTEKPSRLYNNNGQLHLDSVLTTSNGHTINQNIYITSDEEIKEGDWYLNVEEKNGIKNPFYGKLYKANQSIDKVSLDYLVNNLKKIILTTDHELIDEGVQPIDDEFLEWFVKNPNCEEVFLTYEYEQVNQDNPILKGSTNVLRKYKIIILQEESNEETIITAAQSYAVNKKNRTSHYMGFIEGAKWMEKQMEKSN